jgi:ABC-type lipoprotein release transport system permease subunit
MRLFFWVTIAFRFFCRSGKVTVVLALMLFSALATLVFLSSLAVGVNDTMINNSVRLYSGHIAGFELPESLRPEELMVGGVSRVLKRVPVFGILTAGEHSESLNLLLVDPVAEKNITAVWHKTILGQPPASNGPSVFIGKPIADRANLHPGDPVTFSFNDSRSPVHLTVSGVFETGIYRLDNGVAFCAETALPSIHRPWEAAIFLDDGIRPNDIIASFHQTHSSLRFSTWEELMPDLRQLIDLNFFSMSLVTVIVFGVVSIGIACGFIIFILKNIREYGVMKAMGTTVGEIALLIYIKILLITLTTTIAGCTTGIIAVWIARKVGIDLGVFTSHNQYFAVSGVVYPRLTAFSLGVPPLAALVFSFIGALWPTIFLTRKKTAEILRSL